MDFSLKKSQIKQKKGKRKYPPLFSLSFKFFVARYSDPKDKPVWADQVPS